MAQQCLECRTVNADELGYCNACGVKFQRKLQSTIAVHKTWEFALAVGLIVMGVLYLLAGSASGN